MAHLGLAVTRLIRLAYGPFQLGNLPRGALEEVPPRVMREQFGEEAKPGTAEKKPKPERRTRPPPERKPLRPGKRARERMAGIKKAGHADHRR
jgi:23S rRNA pseudouridine2605 synthase